MNIDEMHAQYGSYEAAATAVADGSHQPFSGDDFMSWPEYFRSLISFVQGRLLLQAAPATRGRKAKG